mmetsp:Transcript_61023/g.108498  ORF Transcript_61023/g.108498 Transcript_61023/m.108498 type:complete len:216 (+) Transcript_61023:52-699(+)|eukprot:CAMPEP_0197658288 /NCGR_PEP_ID=MMETSP1338-20131121/45150_1 /TAXON_ID=43686 ORGANISM="Pelagodinium beii, Strain RCC1491" /NCGR_SAMPLE_ID=MMETSP1338 /ASSEMBLY_ACC=CAM_ASM_000754 /LENGTH=215 /DNA_ID=CAMNT_0043234849 /DNA_START=48 /DNA_END=695 /DNA_ORIENTATION=+
MVALKHRLGPLLVAAALLLANFGTSFTGARAKPSKQRVMRHAEAEAPLEAKSASDLVQSLKPASAFMGLLKPVFAAEAKLQALSYDEEAVRAALLEETKSAPVVVYTYSLSPFCTEATALLDSLGAEYKEVELAPEWFLMLGEGAAKRAELGALFDRTSMPHIFIGGESIGGLVEGNPGLVPLYESGELEDRLRAAGSLPAPKDVVSAFLESVMR